MWKSWQKGFDELVYDNFVLYVGHHSQVEEGKLVRRIR